MNTSPPEKRSKNYVDKLLADELPRYRHSLTGIATARSLMVFFIMLLSTEIIRGLEIEVRILVLSIFFLYFAFEFSEVFMKLKLVQKSNNKSSNVGPMA
jgi:hypothetical protein